MAQVGDQLVGERVSLIEFGKEVAFPYRDGFAPVYRDSGSGYVFFDPPPEQELTEYYELVYGRNLESYYTIKTDYDMGRCSFYADEIESVSREFGEYPPANLFELGCAFGGIVAELSRRGYNARGSDINGAAIDTGRREKNNHNIIHASNLEAIGSFSDPLDFIYSFHVLEHDPRMFEIFSMISDALSPSGVLYVQVPNSMYIRALIEGFRGNPWAAFPDHLHMLSAGFLPQLCRIAGLVPLRVQTRTLFAHDEHLHLHFSEKILDERVKQSWDTAMALAGYGMELNFVLTPASGLVAKRFSSRVSQLLDHLEMVRELEVKIREGLEKST